MEPPAEDVDEEEIVIDEVGAEQVDATQVHGRSVVRFPFISTKRLPSHGEERPDARCLCHVWHAFLTGRL
jgi:hypothetical protein